MAKRITELVELAVTPALDDLFTIVDVSESDVLDKNKKIKYETLLAGIVVAVEDELEPWVLDGNTLTGEKFIGPISNHRFPIRTNNTEKISIEVDGAINRVKSGSSGLYSIPDNDGSNVSWGRLALANVLGSSGTNNIGIGGQALENITSGDSCIAIGGSALIANNGNDCIAIGVNAGQSNTDGTNNVFIGTSAGGTNTSGYCLTIVGAGANVATNSLNTSIALGQSATITANNQIVKGHASFFYNQEQHFWSGTGIHGTYFRDSSPEGVQAAQVGSICFVNDGAGNGSVFLKATEPTADTGWVLLGTGGGGAYTDEEAQDAVGAMVSAEFTYTDATPLLAINSIAATKITGTKTSAFISDFAAAVGALVTSSQWIDSGSDIYFDAGNVGIGGAPTGSNILDVFQGANHFLTIDPNGVYEFGDPGVINATYISINANSDVITLESAGVTIEFLTTGGQAKLVGVNDGILSVAAFTTLAEYGITGTKAQFNTACSDGDFLFVGDISAYTDEMVDDRVAALIQNGTGITWSYNDGANTLTPTVTITQYTDEMAQDAIGAMVSGEFTYADATPLLSINSIAWSKINTTPTTLAGYGIADAQPLDADLTSWAGVTRASGFDTFAATPTSANLAALITDEISGGTKLVFQTVTAEQTIASTIAWTGGTPPATPLAEKYKWTQTGKEVTVYVRLEYTTAGVTNTDVTIDFMGDLPTPSAWTSWDNSEAGYYIPVGLVVTTRTNDPIANVRGCIKKTAGGAYQFDVAFSSNAVILLFFTVSYTAA